MKSMHSSSSWGAPQHTALSLSYNAPIYNFVAAPTESPTTVAETTTTTTTTTTPPTGPEQLTSYLDLTSSQEISGEWTIDSLNLYLTPSQLSDIQQISGNKKDIYTI